MSSDVPPTRRVLSQRSRGALDHNFASTYWPGGLVRGKIGASLFHDMFPTYHCNCRNSTIWIGSQQFQTPNDIPFWMLTRIESQTCRIGLTSGRAILSCFSFPCLIQTFHILWLSACSRYKAMWLFLFKFKEHLWFIQPCHIRINNFLS